MKCPECGAECGRDEVDIGVGIQYGPWYCSDECGWYEVALEFPELFDHVLSQGRTDMPVSATNVEQVFTYHPPTEGQPERYQKIREAAKTLVRVIIETTPQCADQQAAIRKVREAVMTANASIALGGEV